MAVSISDSVGEGGANKASDVAVVQGLLNKFRKPKLTESAECPAKTLQELKALKGPARVVDVTKSLRCWPETIKAIREFQQSCVDKGFEDPAPKEPHRKFPKPDGKIGPTGPTWRRLVAAADELGQGRSLILTFDDGPEPVSALKIILNTLQTNSIKAEFYVKGVEVATHRDEAKLIVTSGHRIQNHSYSHPDLAAAKKKDVQTELTKTQDVIKEATGITANKIRPPYGLGGVPGHIDKELLEVANALSLKIVYWDIDTNDWRTPVGISGEKKLDMIAEQFWYPSNRNKKVLSVLMHVQPETARDLPSFISRLKKWGFAFAQPD
jgi:peptidoglycan/xylan/chitin deacetylase (PgdA/CDA1 family)